MGLGLRVPRDDLVSRAILPEVVWRQVSHLAYLCIASVYDSQKQILAENLFLLKAVRILAGHSDLFKCVRNIKCTLHWSDTAVSEGL
jgi:hypothetical protein